MPNSTLITARLDEAIVQDRNLIYCATVNLTWNELSAFLLQKFPAVATDGRVTFPEPCSSVDFLNRRTFTKGDLDERCYLAYASLISDGILARIPKDLRERFNETSKLNLDPANFQPDDIFAYSFLLKILTFQKKFEEVKGHHFRTPGTVEAEPVQTFGIEKVGEGTDREVLKQVRVYSYNDRNDFIISLDTGKDLMVLARVPSSGTLEKTYESVNKRVRDTFRPDSLRPNENLIVPKLAFDLEHHFEEMIGKELLLDGKRIDYFVKDAVQFIKFSLDEEGAKLRSEMAMYGVRCASFNVDIPRRFEFDGPFLIYLKENPELPPYFVAWIGNTEVMKKP